MVVVLVLLFVLFVEFHVSLGDVGLEHFVWTRRQNHPLILGMIEIGSSYIDVAVADADVVALGLQHSRDLPEHLLAVLAGIGSALSLILPLPARNQECPCQSQYQMSRCQSPSSCL